MFGRIRESKAGSPEAIGMGLILVGLIMFAVIFIVAFNVLRDPVGTYDGWFPEEEVVVAEEPIAEPEEAAEPVAAYRFVAETTVSEPAEGEEFVEPRATYRVVFEDRSEPGDAEIVQRTWDLGDGSEAGGPVVNYRYESSGVYSVLLTVADDNGLVSEVEGDVEVPEDGRSFGRVDAADELDLAGLETAVEDAVGTLETSLADTLDSVGSAARSTSVVVLFALAAIAATIVAWRVTRSGVMLLRPSSGMAMKVKSADMHIDVSRQPLEESIDDQLAEASSRDSELLEV